jgi:hypothetical protein
VDAPLARWRRRRATPLTEWQVRRYHRWRFGIAAALFACALLTLLTAVVLEIELGGDAGGEIALIALAALVLYLWTVLQRRWRRL